MIPKSFVQELLNRVDIVDVIEGYVSLKRAGSNLVACCPFHSEKTASFTVSQTKQFYHCFGCGAHGSSIGFLMEHGGLSFVEAVKDLAARAGMQVPESTPEARGLRSVRGGSADDTADGAATTAELAEVLQHAAQFYKSELKKSERAVAYLKGRGLTGDIAARFGLGFAPAGWQNLASAFDDYQSKALVDAGLVIQGEEGKRYDRFRDRIMFPIANQRGQIIGFGGRVMDKSEPKYLNSPETALFEKGRELYGLFQARQGIRAAGRVVVVEGYMDVVALAQYGVTYAVATLGTATTPWHVQKLLRQTDEVVFCFDGDAAGRRAAWRALENSLEQLQDGKQVRFLFLPDGDDPDSYVRKAGREAFEALMARAVPLSEFGIKALSDQVDMGTAEGRAKFLQGAKPLVKQIAAPMLGLMLRRRVAELGGLSEAELNQHFQIKSEVRRGVPAMAARRGRSQPSTVRRLLEGLVVSPQLGNLIDADELASCLAVPIAGETQSSLDLLSALLDFYRSAGPSASLGEHFRGTELENSVAELEASVVKEEWSGLGYEELKVEFLGAWSNLLQKRDEALKKLLIAEGESSGWTQERKEQLRRLQQRPALGTNG
jgi:DNA primase